MLRRRPAHGIIALALSLALHAALCGLLAHVLAADSQKNERPAEAPVRVALVYSGPALIDREPLVLPAGGNGRGADDFPEGTILPAAGTAEVTAPPVPTGADVGSVDAAGKKAAGTPGAVGPGRPALFAGAQQARSVVFVIDHSMSMGRHGALDTARRELIATLQQLPEFVRFQVIVYNRNPELIAPGVGLVPATAQNIRHAATRLESLRAEGGTAHLPALTRALALSPEVIYFLTDADDLDPREQQFVTGQNLGRCCIHVVELHTAPRGRAESSLQGLARANRGTYRAIDLAAYRD